MKHLNEFLNLINEKSESKAQQSLMAVALQVREGDMKISDIENESFKLKVKEIVDGEMTNTQLRDFAETKTKDLPEKLEEIKTIQVKRKYREYDSISVGANAPVRHNILGFIAEKGQCTKDELIEFINSKNEESGSKTNANWIKRNSHYIKEFTKDGCVCCKLSKLGERVVKKTNLNENSKVTNTEIEIIQHYTNITSKVISDFIELNNINIDNLINYLQKGKLKDRVDVAMSIAGFAPSKQKQDFIKKFKNS